MHRPTRKGGELRPNESIKCRSLTEPMPEIAETCNLYTCTNSVENGPAAGRVRRPRDGSLDNTPALLDNTFSDVRESVFISAFGNLEKRKPRNGMRERVEAAVRGSLESEPSITDGSKPYLLVTGARRYWMPQRGQIL
ncbi:hypothetical protein ALC57_10051 [Trachymyrmex cornetzi]|uniref:Uncharacterized protein n=1 Tax=Trachymyrmex cornetzi TaxID=471704 RepID=A0A195DYA2_9HYME|nr:hypothetical protein ALC57_10051 [Trachymyrmex cornetzi]